MISQLSIYSNSGLPAEPLSACAEGTSRSSRENDISSFFLYIMQAGDYQIVMTLPGEEGEESVSWIMTGDDWGCMNGDNPVPDDNLFTYEEDCVYELLAGDFSNGSASAE